MSGTTPDAPEAIQIKFTNSHRLQIYINFGEHVEILVPIGMFLELLFFIIWFYTHHTPTGHLEQVLLNTRQPTKSEQKMKRNICLVLI